MNTDKVKEILDKLSIEEKVKLCVGGGYFDSHGIDGSVPVIHMADGPHGVRKVSANDHLGQANSEIATCFPTASAMASGWDMYLAYKMGTALGRESIHFGVDLLLGPGVNMKRSPLGGRNFEYFSEEPYLTGEIAIAMINGMQSTGIGACVKHFACNNSERNRMAISTEIDDRTLHEIYLKAFEQIVKHSKPKSIMSAYNKVNGTYCSESKELLIDILREAWGFDGIVISDWGAVDNIGKSIQNGLNINMPYNEVAVPRLLQALEDGLLTEEMLNQRVYEVIKVAVDLQSSIDHTKVCNFKENHELAVKLAESSIVLLKNDDQVLPITSKKYKRIGVIGEFAKVPRYQGGGSSKVDVSKVEIPYDNIEKLAQGYGMGVAFAQGYYDDATGCKLLTEARQLAEESDVVVVFIGLPESYESEGYDRSHMEMPVAYYHLLQVINEVQKNVVVVLSNGSAINLTEYIPMSKAILETWLGGQGCGRAIANTLFGMNNPSGKLSETFPACIEDTPAHLNFPGEFGKIYYGEGQFVGYRYYDYKNITPTYCFGHGLSYTTFAYQWMNVEKTKYTTEEIIHVNVEIKNTGDCKGKEVVQLYVSDLTKQVVKPLKELKRFCKVALQKGETSKVTFTLDRDCFSYYNPILKKWEVSTGDYVIFVGTSSRDLRLSQPIHITNVEPSMPMLTGDSSIEEWLNHPIGKGLVESMMEECNAFGLSTKGYYNLDHFIQSIVKEMPLSRMITFSKGTFTDEKLQYMLDHL